ncbi:DUF7065 domain-containing protein [Nocardia miyunensis]|uniref:DUF7065 domain-containing protein n=1 Tax=Nocardia miyunensis TaxID=282684 RepID=UPI00082F0185|nr:hypothetical protein [Nocardia miyunensis]
MTPDDSWPAGYAPDDDLLHIAGPEPNYNESMYFHFADPSSGLGGFFRLASRPNEQNGERTVCLFFPGGEVVFAFAREQPEVGECFRGAGLEFRVCDPFSSHEVRFDGEVVVLSDPAAMLEPRSAFAHGRRTPLRVFLQFRAAGPPHFGSPAGDDFAAHHYEQQVEATGAVVVGDDEFIVRGGGIRDHSWGPRSWQSPWFYRWLHGSGPDMGFMIGYLGSREGKTRIDGFVRYGDLLEQVTGVELHTGSDADEFPDRIGLTISTAAGDLTVSGDVLAAIPLRNRRIVEGSESVTRIAECAVRWRLDDSAGTVLLGLAEYLDQLVGGVPAGELGNSA